MIDIKQFWKNFCYTFLGGSKGFDTMKVLDKAYNKFILTHYDQRTDLVLDSMIEYLNSKYKGAMLTYKDRILYVDGTDQEEMNKMRDELEDMIKFARKN